MLSISFGPEREWWTQGRLFERLMQAAERGGAAPDIIEALRIADANYGLNVEKLAPDLATRLRGTMRAVALDELRRLGDIAVTDGIDGTYKASLRDLVAATE